MTSSSISPLLRQHVTELARHRCGYCLRSEELMGMPLTIDHLIPQAKGGDLAETNLWLACPACNQFKGIQTHALDQATAEMVPLFNPREQNWADHFYWSEDGSHILGKTPCGRVTVMALKINHPQIVVARRLWVSVGWWPPVD